jgi:hypothetical protein
LSFVRFLITTVFLFVFTSTLWVSAEAPFSTESDKKDSVEEVMIPSDMDGAMARHLRFKENGFFQYDTIFEENEFGGVKDTQVFYQDDTGIYLENVFEFTETNVINDLKPTKTRPIALFPLSVGKKWSYLTPNSNEVEVKVVSTNEVVKLPFKTLTDVAKIEENYKDSNYTRFVYFHKDFGEIMWVDYDTEHNYERKFLLSKFD